MQLITQYTHTTDRDTHTPSLQPPGPKPQPPVPPPTYPPCPKIQRASVWQRSKRKIPCAASVRAPARLSAMWQRAKFKGLPVPVLPMCHCPTACSPPAQRCVLPVFLFVDRDWDRMVAWSLLVFRGDTQEWMMRIENTDGEMG